MYNHCHTKSGHGFNSAPLSRNRGSNSWRRNKKKSFYRLPAINTPEGEQTARRLDIKPEKFQHTRVRSDHCICGKHSAALYVCGV